MGTSNLIGTECCDKCGRSLAGKGYIEISMWKICGICQWEKQISTLPPLMGEEDTYKQNYEYGKI